MNSIARSFVSTMSVVLAACCILVSQSRSATQLDVRPVSKPASQAPASDVAPVITMISTHAGIWAMQFSADGRFLASAGTSGEVKLWEVSSGRMLRTMRHEKSVLSDIAITPDGSTIISAETESLKIWESSTGKLRHTIAINSRGEIALSPDGRTIFALDDYRAVRSFDVATGAPKQSFRGMEKRSPILASIALSPDGKLLAAGETQNSGGTSLIAIWDVVAGRLIRTINAHRSEVTGLSFSPDGRMLLSSSYDKTVKLWNVSTGQLQRSFEGHTRYVTSVKYLADGRTFISSGSDENVRMWNVETGKLVRLVSEKPSYALASSPDGRSIALTLSGIITLSDAATGQTTREFRSPLAADQTYARSLSHVGGRWIATYRDDLTRWDARSGELIGITPNKDASRWTGANGTSVGLFAGDTSVTVWDYLKEEKIKTFVVNSGLKDHQIVSLAVSPDGRVVASANYKESNVTLWDASTGQTIRSFDALKPSGSGSFYVHALSFSPDGRWLATAAGPSQKGIRIWDVATGKLLIQMGKDDVRLLKFSADGRRILGGGYDEESEGNSVKLWDAASGKLVQQFKHGFTVDGIAISPDGRYVATTGGLDSGTNVFEVASGNLTRSLVGTSRNGYHISFSPDGEQLAFADSAGALSVWHRESGKLLTTSIRSESGEWVTITPEGFFVASEKGAELLYVVRGFEVSAFDQLYQSLYRPDLVREKLAGDPKGLVREAAARLDLNKVIASGAAPRVSIVTPAGNVGNDDATVEAEIAEQGGGVGRIEWRVNGVTLGVESRGVQRLDGSGSAAPSSRPITVKRTLVLEPGDNRIEVVAYNGRDLIASEPAQVILKWDGEKNATPPKLHVLAVAVNDYYDSRLRLSYAVPDARALGDALKQAGGSLYQAVDVTSVLDDKVTIDNLDRVFADLGTRVHPRDVFVFFLAGHGKTVDGRYHFLPQNFRYEDESSIVKRGIDQERFQAWFARIPARKSILLYDTCESGSLTGDRVQQRGIERVAALEKMTRAMGRTVLSASSDDAPALEGYKGHGVFTYALLDGLAAADTNGNGLIEVTELAAFVDQKVPDLSYQAFKMRQIPQMKIVGNSFAVAAKASVLQATDAATPSEPVPTRPTHVVSPSAIDVYVAAARGGAIVQQLPPGTAVTLIEGANGWQLIAKDGKKLGFVEERGLLKLQ